MKLLGMISSLRSIVEASSFDDNEGSGNGGFYAKMKDLEQRCIDTLAQDWEETLGVKYCGHKTLKDDDLGT